MKCVERNYKKEQKHQVSFNLIENNSINPTRHFVSKLIKFVPVVLFCFRDAGDKQRKQQYSLLCYFLYPISLISVK